MRLGTYFTFMTSNKNAPDIFLAISRKTHFIVSVRALGRVGATIASRYWTDRTH